MEVVDQRDIQRKGGLCAKFPVSCLIKKLLEKCKLSPSIVFDTTYGEGRFYGAWKPELLIGADIVVRDWVVAPDIFIKMPVWSSWVVLEKLGVKPDILIVDPPWGSARYRKRMLFNDGLGGPTFIIDSALDVAQKLHVSTVLVHFSHIYAPRG